MKNLSGWTCVAAAASISLAIGGLMMTQVKADPAVVAPPGIHPPATTVPSSDSEGHCCLVRVHKSANGERHTQASGNTYECNHLKSFISKETIDLRLKTEGHPCDESPELIPDGCLLKAIGRTMHRADGLSSFSGKYQLKTPGSSSTVISEGTIELFERIGTHHPPFGTEKCDQKSHMEGSLSGTGFGSLKGSKIRALVTASVKPETHTEVAKIEGSLDGVVIDCD